MVGAAGSLLVWYRHRNPIIVALLLLPMGAVSGSVTPALAVSVYAVAVHRPARQAVLIAADNVISVLMYFGLQVDPRHPLAVDLVVRGGIITGALGWGLFAGAQRRLLSSLVDQARLTERARIAREMHDVLAHRLSLVSLHAGVLELRTDADPDEIATAAAVIRTNAHAALGELRTVIGVLRDTSSFEGVERPQPTLVDVPDLVTSADYRNEVREADSLDATVGRTVYRIIQEGLTNARKHAPGTRSSVSLSGAPGDGISIEISNPLGAPSTVPGSGLGLIGLAERVELAGGWLQHGPDRGRFRLAAWLPWAVNRRE
ncbi:sensor histidine kinase [Dactylosporangium matsuzakiense]|uniref:histidine kinase n=1 Tax=Dactylosporangium matsuzakiense TaxID=53360 RepID=A0A9W6KNC9_9ACTN|nr:histidine kinase [Dactylosporangium matsuzakiense]GLL05207.1 two-component sensor histidine kinase [Dactylosporangium matsuzakiense]